MEYSSEEWNWIEAEWAYHCFGRTAFLSPEDFRQAKAWAEQGIPPKILVDAMGVFFARRAKRPRPRAFVALSHLKKDVEKAMSFFNTISRAGEPIEFDFPLWDKVTEPLKSNPRAKVSFDIWMQIKHSAPPPESSGYLEFLDSEGRARRAFVEIVTETLGNRCISIEQKLREKLCAIDIPEGSVVWKRAWDHHFAKDVCSEFGIEWI
ncbi:MAG: hypothetical protein FWG02_01290 [Holophagaceae bacterium]|nr:hypothetical protein [Holophagaceae bacterium]